MSRISYRFLVPGWSGNLWSALTTALWARTRSGNGGLRTRLMPWRHTSRLIPADRVPGTLREVGHSEFDLETIGFLGDVRQRSDPVGLVVEALWLISRGFGDGVVVHCAGSAWSPAPPIPLSLA